MKNRFLLTLCADTLLARKFCAENHGPEFPEYSEIYENLNRQLTELGLTTKEAQGHYQKFLESINVSLAGNQARSAWDFLLDFDAT